MRLKWAVRSVLRRPPVVGKIMTRRLRGWHPNLIARGVNPNSNAELLDFMEEENIKQGKFH